MLLSCSSVSDRFQILRWMTFGIFDEWYDEWLPGVMGTVTNTLFLYIIFTIIKLWIKILIFFFFLYSFFHNWKILCSVFFRGILVCHHLKSIGKVFLLDLISGRPIALRRFFIAEGRNRSVFKNYVFRYFHLKNLLTYSTD